MDGQIPYLIIQKNVQTGYTFFIDVLRPLASWIRVGGTWGESTAGLVHETDECFGDLDRITDVTAYYAYTELARHDPKGTDSNYTLMAKDAADKAKPWMRADLMQPTQRSGDVARNSIGDSYAYLAQQWPHGRSRWP